MTPLAYQVVIGLLAAALVIAMAAAAFGGRRINLPAAYDVIKGRWPYIVGASSSLVVAAHSAGYIDDRLFATLVALHGSAAIPALRGALQHIVADAIQRKVTVQVKEARTETPRVSIPPVEPVGAPKEGL